MLITFTAWIIWSRVSSSPQAMKERSKRQVEYTYLVYGMLVFIAIVGMYALNFRPFVGYISRCIVINQDIVVVPRGELCQSEKDFEPYHEKCNKTCKHSSYPKSTFVQMDNDVGWKRYAKLDQNDGEITEV